MENERWTLGQQERSTSFSTNDQNEIPRENAIQNEELSMAASA